MTEGIYYLRLNGKVEGPFTIGQIYDLWAARKINSQTHFARFEEMDKWQPLSELTLKISAPKSSSARTAEPTPAPQTAPMPQGARTRSTSVPFQPDEPPAEIRLQPDDLPTPSPVGTRKSSQLNSGHSFNLNPWYFSGGSIALGVIVTLYFAMVYPLTTRSDPSVAHEIIINRQTGVLSGMALVLTGTLLIVAHQLALLRSALQAELDKKSPKNLS